jgi:hypothetical protein
MEDIVIKDTEKKLYNLYEGRKIKRKGKWKHLNNT